jgi:hypothetical protein
MFFTDLPLEIECYGFTFIFKVHSSTLTFGENSTSISPNDQWILLAKEKDFCEDKIHVATT